MGRETAIMKRFKIFHIPVLSFFSKELYRDVGLNWKGTCFGYLFLLLAVCWIPVMVTFHLGLSRFIEDKAPVFIEQVPEITITDGQASIEEPQPYYITAGDANDVLMVIDTTGQINSPDDANAFVLLTKTKLIHRKSDVELQTFDLAQVKEFTLNQTKITSWLNVLAKIFAPVSYVFALIGSCVFRIIQALIYAAIGMLFVSWCKARLTYDALLRLAVVAVTPCIIVKTILSIADIRIPYAPLLYLIAALAYLFFGVKAASEPVQPASFEESILPETDDTQWK